MRTWDIFLTPYSKIENKRKIQNEITSLKVKDVTLLMKKCEAIPFSWQARYAIILSYHCRVPMTWILQARWSLLQERKWLYKPVKDKMGYYKTRRIDSKVFEILKIIHELAIKDGIESDYWFPNEESPNKPIATIERAWNYLVHEMGWKNTTHYKFIKKSDSVRIWGSELVSSEGNQKYLEELDRWLESINNCG